MKKAAVVIDAWKLPVFERHLKAAGYCYTCKAGVTQDGLLLEVPYEWAAKLKPIIEAANAECAKASRP